MDSSPELSKLPHLMDIPEDSWDLRSNSSTTWFPLDSHEMWVVPLLACSSVNILVILSYEVYIVSCSRVSTSFGLHLFLGQMLLLGLLLGSCLGFAFAVESSPLSCVAIRVGSGLAYVLIYGALLVKLVFLVALNSGVYLPVSYQMILFFFCILVQIVIDIQWVITVPFCQFITRDLLYSFLYIIFLILAVTCLAVKSRYIIDNYREATYICLVMVVTVCGWVSWITAAVIMEKQHTKPCTGFGLVLSCSITFIVMFLPKSRQQTAMGKEGVYIQEPHDTFSISSQSSHHCYGKENGFTTKSQEAHNHFSTTEGSYLGFHRPLRVVPPKSSPLHSSSVPSFLLPPPAKPNHSHFPHQNYKPFHQEFGQQKYQEFGQHKYQSNLFPSHFSPQNLYQYFPHYNTSKGMGDYNSPLFNRGRRKYENPRIFLYRPNYQPFRY